MTREEAIAILLCLKDRNVKCLELIRRYPFPNRLMLTTQALDMAIEALSEETSTIQEKHQLSGETPTDLISRADVLEGLKHSTAYLHDDIYTIVNRIPSAETTGALDDAIAKYVADGLMELPSADAVHGEWVRKYDDKINCYWYECDQCGEYRPRNQFGKEYNANFCPNCGADMRGEEE